MTMFSFLKSLFSKEPPLSEILEDNPHIVDVRTQGEFRSGHVKGSQNIPLDQINNNVNKLAKKGVPIVLCCASGMRSGRATRILRKHGLEAYNGGAWQHVNQALKRN